MRGFGVIIQDLAHVVTVTPLVAVVLVISCHLFLPASMLHHMRTTRNRSIRLAEVVLVIFARQARAETQAGTEIRVFPGQALVVTVEKRAWIVVELLGCGAVP